MNNNTLLDESFSAGSRAVCHNRCTAMWRLKRLFEIHPATYDAGRTAGHELAGRRYSQAASAPRTHCNSWRGRKLCGS
jgi:hypothetical protein